LFVALVAVPVVLGAASCAQDSPPGNAQPSTPPSASAVVVPSDADSPTGLAGLSGELVLTRQRDLLDRGLVNVLTHNRTGDDIVITDRVLVADHFAAVLVPSRRSSVRNGRNVALQVPYGTASDCATATSVEAHLEITYVVGDDAQERTGELDLGGTDILDAIRAEQCTVRAFEAATDVSIDDVVVEDREVTATIVVSRTSDESSLSIGAMRGTVLVGVEASAGSFERVTIGPEPVAVPVTFIVNRCDPHALAEVTKRYGLDLEVIVDDAPAQAIPLDITELTPALDQIVERCTTDLD
jgi:hypothetical protein